MLSECNVFINNQRGKNTFFLLIGPTRGFTKEAEGKERDDGSCEKLQKTWVKAIIIIIIITWLLLWLNWESECVQIATFQQTPHSCPPQWNLGRNCRKGNEEHRLDIRMAWLSDNQQKSMAFSSWGLICMEAQRGFTNWNFRFNVFWVFFGFYLKWTLHHSLTNKWKKINVFNFLGGKNTPVDAKSTAGGPDEFQIQTERESSTINKGKVIKQ